MTAPATGARPERRLLLSLVRLELASQRCPGCGAGQVGARLRWVRSEPARVTLRALCPSCGRSHLLVVEPGTGAGHAEIA